MIKKQFAVGVALIGLLLAVAFLRTDSSTPRGQDPLVSLTNSNFISFETAFDKSRDGPRLVLLLSPT
jgi:hypothetical protein